MGRGPTFHSLNVFTIMKIILFANTDWYLYNFRLALAKAIREAGHEVVLMSPSGAYHLKFQTEGFRWLETPVSRRGLNPYSEVVNLFKITRLLRYEKPDLIHNFTIKCVIYGSIAAMLSDVKKRVNAIAGMGYIFSSPSIKARVLKPLVKYLLRFSTSGKKARVIVQNNKDLNDIVEERIVSSDRIILIKGSGVNLDRFTPSTSIPVDGTLKVLMATRMLWGKGVGDFVEAAENLHGKGVHAEFYLAGEIDPGNPDSIRQKTLADWNAAGFVKVIGHVDDMPKLISNAAIVVLPTRYGEGVPRVLLEAAASGKPIIASDNAGCQEIVEHGRNGLIVPKEDVALLNDAIVKLLEDANLRARMGAYGRRKAETEFGEISVIQRTLDIYKSLQ